MTEPLGGHGERPRVLLADDSETVLEDIRSLLEPEFEVVGTVRDGQSLLAAAETLKPDLMVVDVSMPVLSGLKAVRRLKEHDPNAKVVFLTVHQDPAVVNEALAAGALGYVVKPAAGDQLVNAIQEALQGRSYISPCLPE